MRYGDLKRRWTRARLLPAILLAAGLGIWGSESSLIAQPFLSGSDGSDGPLNIAASSGTFTLSQGDPDGDGVYHFTTVTIGGGSTVVVFPRNDLDSPIIVLATLDIIIEGTVRVDGTSGGTGGSAGLAGPGGFDGGLGGGIGFKAGDGFGPGAGKRQQTTADGDPAARAAGNASYATVETGGAEPADGATYGSSLLVPIIGGSGGGAGKSTTAIGPTAGGGGGAILFASTTRISLSGAIQARGGSGSSSGGGIAGAGSGGAVRLIAPVVEGSGSIDTIGGFGFSVRSGKGRSRVDTIDRSNLNISFRDTIRAIGSFMTVFPTPNPKLEIISAAGSAVNPATPAVIQLLFGSPSAQIVRVRATNFTAPVDINVVVTPESGDALVFPATIITSGAPAEQDVAVSIPPNTVAHIDVWTR